MFPKGNLLNLCYFYVNKLWLFLKNYVIFSYFSPPICDFDVFEEGKTHSFFESQQAIMAICTYLQGLHKNMEDLSEEQLLEQFLKLVQVCVLSSLLCL